MKWQYYLLLLAATLYAEQRTTSIENKTLNSFVVTLADASEPKESFLRDSSLLTFYLQDNHFQSLLVWLLSKGYLTNPGHLEEVIELLFNEAPNKKSLFISLLQHRTPFNWVPLLEKYCPEWSEGASSIIKFATTPLSNWNAESLKEWYALKGTKGTKFIAEKEIIDEGKEKRLYLADTEVGDYALLAASSYEEKGLLKKLIKRGALLNTVMQDGDRTITPLGISIWCKHIPALLYYIDHADIDLNKKYTSPGLGIREVPPSCHLVEVMGDSQVTRDVLSQLLKKKSFNPCLQDSNGNTVLHYAAAISSDLYKWLTAQIPSCEKVKNKRMLTPLQVSNIKKFISPNAPYLVPLF